MPTPLNSPAARSFHEQVHHALPAGFTASTSGDSSTGRVSALVCETATRAERFYIGTPADVLKELSERHAAACEFQRAGLAKMSR